MDWKNIEGNDLDLAMSECESLGLERFRNCYGFHAAQKVYMYSPDERGPFEARPLIAAAYAKKNPDQRLKPTAFFNNDAHSFLTSKFSFIQRSKSEIPPVPPEAADFEPPARQETTSYRIIRDTLLSRRVKEMYGYKCQLCQHTIRLPDGTFYAEAHHIRPLGSPHNGPDCMANIICLCPNHHAELDYGARELDVADIHCVNGHLIDGEYIEYHNSKRNKNLR